MAKQIAQHSVSRVAAASGDLRSVPRPDTTHNHRPDATHPGGRLGGSFRFRVRAA